MAEYTAVAIQRVAPGSNILFSETPVSGCRAVNHREGSGIVTLRGLTEQCRARFRVYFSGNIAVPDGETVGPIALAISLDGEGVGSSTMISTPAAVDDYNNVSSAVFIDVPRGDNVSVAVRNVVAPVDGATAIAVNVQNANLIVERMA